MTRTIHDVIRERIEHRRRELPAEPDIQTPIMDPVIPSGWKGDHRA